jgi:hypothetical protein
MWNIEDLSREIFGTTPPSLSFSRLIFDRYSGEARVRVLESRNSCRRGRRGRRGQLATFAKDLGRRLRKRPIFPILCCGQHISPLQIPTTTEDILEFQRNKKPFAAYRKQQHAELLNESKYESIEFGIVLITHTHTLSSSLSVHLPFPLFLSVFTSSLLCETGAGS